MSSIAYVTDQNMIEYHRLHGNRDIVFWRPSSQKSFQHFYPGDYLFFLTKGTEKGKNREKGIVGYGRYRKEEINSVKQIWRKYQTLCGYGSEKLLQDAILNVSKTHQLPQKMHCLLLERVIFFQAPIYFSEFQKEISKQIESYIYLDVDDPDTGWNILQKAMQVGVDMWTTYVENQNVSLQQDADILLIQNIHEQCQYDSYTEYEIKKVFAFAQRIVQYQEGSFLSGKEPGKRDDFFLIENGIPCFYLPCMMNLKSWKKQLLYNIAKASLYQQALLRKNGIANVSIVMNTANKEGEALCRLANIPYKIMEM